MSTAPVTSSPTSAVVAPVGVVAGSIVKIVKGCREMWSGKAGRHIAVRAGDRWVVTSVNVDADNSAHLVMHRLGSDVERVLVGCSSAAKLRRPEINLHRGDPTKSIRVKLVSA